MPNSQKSSQLAAEQSHVDAAYATLDHLRRLYRHRQASEQAKGASGTHQARSERDAISSHFGDEAARLEQLEDRLVFGKLVDDSGAARYIGRTGLVDEDGRRVLMDWRAPAALPFYQATAVHPLGVALRRHLLTRLRKVVDIEDELLADAPGASSDHLQGEGALMAALSRARTGHMGDIVATIQAEQDRVIRAPGNGIVVVQGGPGTGKTAVALHRAAYLLYAEHERLARSGVLVVGPTRRFLRYIEKVLPSLGETGVVSLTPGALVPGVRPLPDPDVAVAKLKGDLRFAEAITRAIRATERVPRRPVTLAVGSKRITVTPGDVRAAAGRARRTGLPHNEAWKTFAKALLETMSRKMAPDAAPGSDELDWALFDLRSSDAVRKFVNWHWLPATATELVARLLADPKRLSHAAPFLSPAEVEQLVRPMSAPWTVSDVALIDEAWEQLGTHPQAQAREAAAERERRREVEAAQRALDTGFDTGLVSAQMVADRASEVSESSLAARAGGDRSWTYGHIVVDEAQELSPMQWRALLRRCPARSMTVVGDLDQQQIDHGQRTWHDVLGPAAQFVSQEVLLRTSYRTPATIMEAATRVMESLGRPIAYPVEAVRDLPDCLAESVAKTREDALGDALDQAQQWAKILEGEGGGKVALISLEADTLADLATDTLLVATPEETKGLEFDVVIVHDPHGIARRSTGDLFVALTRATRHLFVASAQKSLPGLCQR